LREDRAVDPAIQLPVLDEPIVTTSLADEIAFRLQAAIVDGTLRPGMALRQEEICRRFGVSRTPVREALRTLQAQSLVVIAPHRGAVVRLPDRSEVREIYVLRAELEGLACELAAQAIAADADLVAALERAQAAVEAATAELEQRPRDAQQGWFFLPLIRANDRFHEVVHDAAGNARLRATLVGLQSSFPKDLVWRAVRSAGENRAFVIDEHRAVLDALRSGDAPGSRRLMARHVSHAGDVLLEHLDHHDFWKG
jgi:DNA-binding GntR family transcriptional regulator